MRFVCDDEGKELHWPKGVWVGCCEQEKYTCWKAPEKMTQSWWTGTPRRSQDAAGRTACKERCGK